MKPMPIYTISPNGEISTDRLWLTIDEVAQLLGVSAKGLRNSLAPGSTRPPDPRLRYIRFGKLYRFRLDDVLKIAADANPSANGQV